MSEIYSMWDKIIAAESSGDFAAANAIYKRLNKRAKHARA